MRTARVWLAGFEILDVLQHEDRTVLLDVFLLSHFQTGSRNAGKVSFQEIANRFIAN